MRVENKEVNKLVMKRVWKIAKKAQEEFGGSSKDYLSQAMKQVWQEVKEGLEIICYRKKDDDYKGKYYQIVEGLTEKTNKKTGEPYYSCISLKKGFRNFKHIEHRIKLTIKDLKNVKALMVDKGDYIESL